jgi:hypothetical protein
MLGALLTTKDPVEETKKTSLPNGWPLAFLKKHINPFKDGGLPKSGVRSCIHLGSFILVCQAISLP